MQIPTYEDQLNLVNKGLAKVSKNGNLHTFKYKSDVMYKNRWNESKFLMECRGHTYDEDSGKLLVLPFRKSFNYGEKGWWSDIDLFTTVVMYKKYNGFMAAVSNGILSTTGTTNSDFVKMAKECINPDTSIEYKHFTLLYEVNHPKDQHIVEEEIGAEFLGLRHNDSGKFDPYGEKIECSLRQALQIAKHDRGEGYMIYFLDPYNANQINSEYFCKVKSDRYRSRKALIRINASSAKTILQTEFYKHQQKMNLPDNFKLYAELLFNKISVDDWIAFTSEQRFATLSELEKQHGF